MDRNAALVIVKEVRLEWSKVSRSTIFDKKGVTKDMRNTFQDTMKIG